jgi:hypothetical protein
MEHKAKVYLSQNGTEHEMFVLSLFKQYLLQRRYIIINMPNKFRELHAPFEYKLIL